MMYKKMAGLFLFVSFQAYGMLMVNQLPKKKVVKGGAGSINKSATRVTSIENYNYNESFFRNNMIPDAQPLVMSNLDHRSNIQLIQTTKRLYNRYVQQVENGKKYHMCLFTKHPFEFSAPVNLDVYFDCYTRALFHYARQHPVLTKILLSIEDDVIQVANAKFFKKVKINSFDADAVMSFYKQAFTAAQSEVFLENLGFLESMLKRGMSPNAQYDKEYLINKVALDKEGDLLKILLGDPRFDPNIQDRNGNTILHSLFLRPQGDIFHELLLVPGLDTNRMLILGPKIKAIKMLMSDSRIDPSIKNKDGNTVLDVAILLYDIKGAKILLPDHCIDSNLSRVYGITSIRYVAKDILFTTNSVNLNREGLVWSPGTISSENNLIINPNTENSFRSGCIVFSGNDLIINPNAENSFRSGCIISSGNDLIINPNAESSFRSGCIVSSENNLIINPSTENSFRSGCIVS